MIIKKEMNEDGTFHIEAYYEYKPKFTGTFQPRNLNFFEGLWAKINYKINILLKRH